MMLSSVKVYLIIGVMVLMPILYFGLRAAFRYKHEETMKRFKQGIILTIVGLVLAEAAVFGLYSYTVNNLPMLVMERAVRDAAAGTLEGKNYLAEGAVVDAEGFSGADWSGAMIAMPKKVMEDEEGHQLFPVRLETADEISCVLLFRLSEDAEGETAVPARIESMEYIAPEEIEEKIGVKMTYFDTSALK